MNSDAVDETGTTNSHHRVSRTRVATLLAWIILAAGAGLTASLGFDVRLALAVVIVARAVHGVPAGVATLVSAAVVTFVARGYVSSAEPHLAPAAVASLFLVVESVALSHLVLVLTDRVSRRTNPIRRFAVVSVAMVATSLVLAAFESVVANVAIDESVASFWERGAAVTAGSLLGLCATVLVQGRWFRFHGLSFDELTAPFAALMIVVLALQATGEIWRSADEDRLRDAARTTMTAFLDDVSGEVNDVIDALGTDDDALATRPAVIGLMLRSESGDDELLLGDEQLFEELLAVADATARDVENRTRLLGDGLIVVDRRNLLLFEFISDSTETETAITFLIALDADRLLASASDSLAGAFGDVEVSLVPSIDDGQVTGTIDGAVVAMNGEPAAGFGMDGQQASLVLLFEVLLGAAVIAVLLLGASAQVRVALERRRRESLLEAALDATPGLSVVFDQDMTVLAGNRVVRDAHAGRVPGIPVIDVLGFGPETVRARIVGELLAKVLGGEGGHAEVSGGEGDEMRILELEAYPVSVPGDERIGFLHVSDATERRSMAMRTAQAERMESLGALAGGLAHDFNNLLFVTLGNLQLMAMNETITKDEKLAKFLSRSMSAVERGAEITKSLLAVARSQPLEETAVSLADLIKGLLPLVKQAVGAGRTVEVDIPDPNLHLMVDAGRLQSCILNLAFNSRDAMGPNGRVRIAARRREDTIELSVSDDGAGMPAEVVARAFEPFFTTKKAGSGTGLGLATVYAFAQQSGGTATLDSRPGVGTTVTLVLPLHVPGVASERLTSTRRAGRRVVVADDEQALAEMVAAWLIDVGVDARFALSPREALDLISEFRPDVLVSDANFGLEQDGLDLARLATADQPDLAVIFMTGYSSSMKQLQELGERTLAKPFSREDLYAAVLPLVADDGVDANSAHVRTEEGETHG